MHCQALNAKKCGYFFHQEIGFNPQNSGRNKSDQVFGHAINIDGLEQIFFFLENITVCIYCLSLSNPDKRRPINDETMGITKRCL